MKFVFLFVMSLTIMLINYMKNFCFFIALFLSVSLVGEAGAQTSGYVAPSSHDKERMYTSFRVANTKGFIDMAPEEGRLVLFVTFIHPMPENIFKADSGAVPVVEYRDVKISMVDSAGKRIQCRRNNDPRDDMYSTTGGREQCSTGKYIVFATRISQVANVTLQYKGEKTVIKNEGAK